MSKLEIQVQYELNRSRDTTSRSLQNFTLRIYKRKVYHYVLIMKSSHLLFLDNRLSCYQIISLLLWSNKEIQYCHDNAKIGTGTALHNP